MYPAGIWHHESFSTAGAGGITNHGLAAPATVLILRADAVGLKFSFETFYMQFRAIIPPTQELLLPDDSLHLVLNPANGIFQVNVENPTAGAIVTQVHYFT